MITVTLQQIKDARPCASGWAKVLKANSGTDADLGKPFPLVSILDSNDLSDTLWVISNVPEMAAHGEVWRKFSCWCAMQNVEKIAKYCSQDDYNLIVKWLETNDPDLRESARSAAESTAESTAESAAESAARAAWSAAWSAESAESAESAAWSAAWSAESAESAARSAAESAAESAVWSVWSAAESAESAARSAAESAAESAVWSVWSAAESAESAARSARAAQKQKLIEILSNY